MTLVWCGFLYTKPKVLSMKEIIGKFSFIKNKKFCSEKGIVGRMNREDIDWEIIFAK